MSVKFCKKMFVIFTRIPIGKADEIVYCKGHRAEICLRFGWLFGRFEDTKIVF